MTTQATEAAPSAATPEQLRARLNELEDQRQVAQQTMTLAGRRIEGIAARQQQIAVAVMGEDPEALNESEQLEEELQAQQRRQAVAHRAAQQLAGLVVRAREDVAVAERRKHEEAFRRLAEDRYALEEEAEAQVAALLNTLRQLRHIDGRQREAGYRAGRTNIQTQAPLANTLDTWLSNRFGGVGGYLNLNPTPGTAGRTLAQLDGFAGAARSSSGTLGPAAKLPTPRAMPTVAVNRRYGKTAGGVSYHDLSREDLVEEARKRGLRVAVDAEEHERGEADYVTRLELVGHLEARDRSLGLVPPQDASIARQGS